MKIKISIILLSLIISGCASDRENIIKEQALIEKQRIALEKKRNEYDQEKREAEISNAPEWAINPPDKDDSGIYAVGIAQSDNMYLAMKKAKLQAEFDLAKQINQLLSGSERSFEREGSFTGKASSQIEFLIDKIIHEVPIVGYSTARQKLQPLNGQHVAYILLKLPYNEINKTLNQKRALADDAAMKKAFDELYKRLDASKQPSAAPTSLAKYVVPPESRTAENIIRPAATINLDQALPGE